jgi:hypothetical protein
MQFNEKLEKSISESVQQFRVCNWLDSHNIVYFAVPNGKWSNFANAAKAKREGQRPGVPDLFLLTKCKLKKPIALEMKKYLGAKHRLPCNCMSTEQLEWRDKTVSCGFIHLLAHGSDDAISTLADLYNLPK